LSDADDVEEGEKKDIPSVFQDKYSPSDTLLGWGEKSGDSTRDTLGDESLVTIQPEKHMMEHELAKEEAMHIMHDSPLGEIQMEAHTEFVMDVQLPLRSTMGVE